MSKRQLGGGFALALALLGTAVVASEVIYPLSARRQRDSTLLASSRLHALPINAAYGSALGPFFLRGSALRTRVGIQVGHWEQAEVPPELARLREATGAEWGKVREVDVNMAIARHLAALLGSTGVEAELLPATVPPGYLADAFVAIHADGAARPSARGWKIATAWRASQASRELAEALSGVYGAMTGLSEDRYGVTYGMKGYYAFSPQRVRYAVSPFTPCIIVETGFVTVPEDREVIVEQPGRVAKAIAAGLLRYLAGRPPPRTMQDRSAFLPLTYPIAVVTAAESSLRAGPSEEEPLVRLLVQGTPVLPMQIRGAWIEVVVRGDFRSFGWIPARDLEPAG